MASFHAPPFPREGWEMCLLGLGHHLWTATIVVCDQSLVRNVKQVLSVTAHAMVCEISGPLVTCNQAMVIAVQVEVYGVW